MNEILETYTMTPEEEIKWLRQCVRELQEQLDYLRSGKYLNQVKWERDFNEKMVEDLQNDLEAANSRTKELSERIIKAIEFVEEFIKEDYYEKLDEYITYFTWNKEKENLLEILKGEPSE